MKFILTYIFLISAIVFAQHQDAFELNQYMLAENYEQTGNISKAIEILEQLFQKNPNNPNYFSKLYNLYLSSKKYETAIRFVELRLASNPEDPSLYGLLGSVYYLMGEIKKAKENWEIPIKKNPENPFIYRMMANYAIERRGFEIAIDYLETGKKKSNDPTIFAMDLGELYLITMQYESAVKEYCEMLTKNQEMYPVVENKIFSVINKPNVVQPVIKVVRTYQNKGVVFKNLLARLYTETKEFDKAFELYKEIEKEQSTNYQQLLNYANFLTSENQFEIAKKVFEYIYQNSTNASIKSSAKLGLIKNLEAMLWNDFNNLNDLWKNYYIPKYFSESQTRNVIAAYEEVINLFKYSDVAVEALYSIGRISFYINNNLQKAEESFLEIVKNYPTSRFGVKSILKLALIKLSQNKLDEAKNYFKKVESTTSYSDEEKLTSYFYLSKLYAFEGDFLSASENIKKITNNVKNDFTNDALEFSLLLNVAKNDSSNLIKYTQAEILVFQKQFREAQILFDEIAQHQRSLVFQPFCMIKSAEIDLALDSYNIAIEKFDNIYHEKEKNIFSDKALYLKAKIYQFAFKDLPKAIDVYEKILIEFPKSIYLDESRETIIRLKEEINKREKDA